MPQTITPCQGKQAGTFQATALAMGPSGMWRHDEAAGTTMVDSSGNGHHGAYTNGPTLLANPAIGAHVVGNVGSAITLDATLSQFGSLGLAQGTAAIVTAVFSVVQWYKGTMSGASNPMFICSDDAGAERWFQFRMSTTGKLEFICFDSALNPYTKTGAVTINDGAWHFLVGTFDVANNVTIYVDGVQDGAAVAGAAPHSTAVNKIGIGERFAGVDANFLTGTVDESIIYPYALTAAQVALLYASA